MTEQLALEVGLPRLVEAKFIGGPLDNATGLRVPVWPTPSKDFEDGNRVPSGWPSEWGPAWVISSTRACRQFLRA